MIAAFHQDKSWNDCDDGQDTDSTYDDGGRKIIDAELILVLLIHLVG